MTEDTLVLLEPREVVNEGQVILPFDSAHIDVSFNTGEHLPSRPRESSWGLLLRRQRAAPGVADSVSLMIWWYDKASLAVAATPVLVPTLSPDHQRIAIDFPNGTTTVNFAVYDEVGRAVRNGISFKNKLSIEELPSGIYFIICNAERRFVFKHTIRK